MRNIGGKKMQALSNKYSPRMDYKEIGASDRFNVRVRIAKQVTRSITELNGEVCRIVMSKTMKGMYKKEKW